MQVRIMGGDVDTAETKRAIRSERADNQHKPSLQQLGWTGRLYTLFVPAVLGDPTACRQYGALARLLYREATRSKKPIKAAMVPGWSGPQKVVCPFLDEQVEYVAYAANGGRGRSKDGKPRTNRQGRGYLLKTWAERLERDVKGFLDALAVAAPRLGLIPAALDADGTWYDLAQLRAAGPEVRDRVNLRIYTPHDDVVTRWCAVFGWARVSAAQDGEARAVQPTDEIAEIRAIIRDRGIRRVADELGIDASNLSKILSGRRRPRTELMARLRAHIRGTQPLGGTGTGSIFGGCSSMLDYALAYRRLGWAVVPMRPPSCNGKKPLVKYKPYFVNLPSEPQVRKWWTWWPDAGIGLILGPVSGVLAIDVDGKDAYDELSKRLGTEPAAPKAMSGSDDPYRMHFFFRHPVMRTKAKATPWHKKLEFRGHTGLIVLAPSPHKSGKTYRWEPDHSIEKIALPELPQPVFQALEAEAMPKQSAPAARTITGKSGHGTIVFNNWRVSRATADFLAGKYADAVGERNHRLFAAACELAARKIPRKAAEPALLKGVRSRDEAERREWLATINSAYSKPRKVGR